MCAVCVGVLAAGTTPIELGAPFRDNGILQQQVPVPVWGNRRGGSKSDGRRDGVWHWADGAIEGGELVVSCPDVKYPVAVLYAYTTHPTGVLLYNKDGLPASPFSTSLIIINNQGRSQT
jgi:hypothetical protein